uniref:Retrotransposon protein, putative, unclassified n=2 Tax=Oryza sativa subsp. japonica TaxID=39947 RepID=Q8S6X3_ORYSJ|nr:Putative retroelement [Oryza sativa Japonica Group]AAP52790.1 retrotransposon protein, putative, unclassified [Oryza sativa Japonica Group]
MAEERESFESQWAPSNVTEENLKEMVVHGVLPAKEIIGWRPAYGEAFPTPNTHEVVETWNSLPMGDETAQALTLLNRIMKLKEQVQAAKIAELKKRIETLEKDKGSLIKERESAIKDVEDRKIKSQAQFDILVNKIKNLEGARDEVAKATMHLIQAMFYNNNGPSTIDLVEVFDKLRAAPDTCFKNIKEAGSMGASMALAMTKSLYPKIDIDAIDGFAEETSEEDAL